MHQGGLIMNELDLAQLAAQVVGIAAIIAPLIPNNPQNKVLRILSFLIHAIAQNKHGFARNRD
jgi:hypothetical protein